MQWKKGIAPNTPSKGMIKMKMVKIELTWFNDDPNTAYFAIYRFKKDETVIINNDLSAKNLIGYSKKN